ncbi:unnamed protein product [Euphydryas editha]|uniref:Tyrosine-protein phosphatase domain-containing protein n=1 Tax=Euphydryas editha TaxID=104508 RepID=A0AAU9TSP3_EUPED|nr:unnamed protein product [Euphydryas editha]
MPLNIIPTPKFIPISVKEFKRHLQESDFLEAIQLEHYQIVAQQHFGSFEHFSKLENCSKNRYNDILCWDETRVKITPKKEDTDYIHANYVDSFEIPKKYVATQGPLEKTVEHFWQLIWEQNSCIIVMLTKLQDAWKISCAVLAPLRQTSSFSSCAGPSSMKRKRNDTIVDPDTKQEIQDPKRPRMVLDTDKKVRCLKTLTSAYTKIIEALSMIMSSSRKTEDASSRTRSIAELKSEVILASQVTSIIFTAHNINRQKVRGTNTNMQQKAGLTDYNIHFMGNDYSIPRAEIDAIWLAETKKEGLEYKNYTMDNKENWYGTKGPYFDMFAAFKLRLDELRLGHGTMPITKKDGTHTSFQVSKYGLTGAHHTLLEGSSFPPERRSSIVQILGPMTAFLCLISTEGIYRNKFAAAVKRAMSHIPSIDDIIDITKNIKTSFELSTMISLIAEILLITTSRQATRMCFPINFLVVVLEDIKREEDKVKFLEFFNTTGSGGWLLYKLCMNRSWNMQGLMTEEVASQIVYHSIFGTYKEDLSILSQITKTGNWYTREEILLEA